MAAYAALVSLLNNIHAITNHPRLSTSLDNTNIQPLLERTNFLLDFIEGNNYGGGREEAQDLERQIADAAHAAEDLIESHIVDQIHAGAGEGSLAGSLDLQQSIRDMDVVMEKIVELKEKGEFNEEKPTHQAVSRALKDGGEIVTVGLDAELNQLLDELTSKNSNWKIISVVGMGGSGKTTLAKSAYDNLLLWRRFDFCAWATISQQSNSKEILLQLLSSLGKPSCETIDDLGQKLYENLIGRRYLIILDDIWSVKAWYEVKHFFPVNENGSRILLTTRLSNVAKDCGSSLLMKNLLDEENSWKLFCEKAFENKVCPPELHDAADGIVKSCKGLALSIVVIGGLLLNSPRTLEYWDDVRKKIKSVPHSEEKQESLDVLSLSYNHLPPQLKPCFLYMGVFEEDSEIRISRIINLWVAEGFIKPFGSRVLEEIAEGYIMGLIDRNLIFVSSNRKNEKFGYCRIHDLLRDLCIELAKRERFFIRIDDKMEGTERRLFNNMYYGSLRGELPLLRSFIAPINGEKMDECRLLRVCDKNDEGEQDWFRKVNLRYYATKCSYGIKDMWEIPTSVSLVWNLQTLIIKRRVTIVAPFEFWKMQQLRHVDFKMIYLPDLPPSHSQDGLLMLANLHTLKTILNLKLCEEVCTIIPNIKKLHLVYDRDLHGYDDDSLIECVCNLDRLHKLESLYLSIRSSRWPTPDTELNKKLSTSFPSSLNKLSLSHCFLAWDDMKMIGSLPQLEVLKLEPYSFKGERWSPVSGQFPRLKFLKIYWCELTWWDADDSHFPVLKKLILEDVYPLREIPMGIGDILTLELISVDCCSNSAAISAVKLKEDQLENDDLKVEVRVSRSKQKDFKKKLEEEGLTLANIHFKMYYLL